MSTTAASSKTICPVSRDEFDRNAKPITLDTPLGIVVLETKEFSTKSLGWFANGPVHVKLENGVVVKCQLQFQLTLANSKELPERVLSPETGAVKQPAAVPATIG